MNQVTKIDLPDWVFNSTEGQVSKQLRWSLRSIDHLLSDPTITDVHVNGNGRIFLKQNGKRRSVEDRLPQGNLLAIATNAAVLGRNRLTEEMPAAPGRFPDGQRGFVVRSPALPEGQVALSIRRQSSHRATPDTLEKSGVFKHTINATHVPERHGTRELLALQQAGKTREFIEAGFRYGYNGVFAGQMNTGKTHNLRAFFEVVDLTTRILTVQYASELETLPQPDIVHLLYPKDPTGVAKHTAEMCVEWGLTMDFDQIVNGEVKDEAVWSLLRAAATGCSIKTSCHANSAKDALRSIFLMARQHTAAQSIETEDMKQLILELIDFVVFSENIDGERRVTQIWFDPDARRQMPVQAARALSESTHA